MLINHNMTERDGFNARHYEGPDWRLVHDGFQVLALIPPPGCTSTLAPILVTGTESELRDEIVRLELIFPE